MDGSAAGAARTSLVSFGTSTLAEAAMGAARWLPRLRPLWPGCACAGITRTVAVPPGDNLGVHQVVALCQPGEVVLVAAGGQTEVALVGEILAVAASARGAVGLIVDGAVRDTAALRDLGLPVFAAGISPVGPGKSRSGEIDVTIRIGEVEVGAGEWLVGDDDGVIVFPPALLEGLLKRAEARREREEWVLTQVRAGRPTLAALAESSGLGQEESVTP